MNNNNNIRWLFLVDNRQHCPSQETTYLSLTPAVFDLGSGTIFCYQPQNI